MITLQDALINGSGIERPFCCPVHGDTNPSASVNIAKKVWYCYVCGATGKLDDPRVQVSDENFYEEVMSMLNVEEQSIHSESWLDQYDAGPIHEYWLSRFPESVARDFRLGWDYQKDQGTYPLRDPQGRVLGVVRRNLVAKPKYLYPKGVTISKLLFGYEKALHSTVFLVEGAMDVIAAYEVGFSALGIYGSKLSLDQVHLLQRMDPHTIVLAYDMDDAGRQAVRESEKLLAGQMPTTNVVPLVWDRADGKDLADLNVKKRQRLLSSVA